MATTEEKLQAAKKRQAEAAKKVRQLQAHQARIEARKLAPIVRGQSAADTRRKILLGAYLLEAAEGDVQKAMRLATSTAKDLPPFHAWLSKDKDRELFGLEVKTENP